MTQALTRRALGSVHGLLATGLGSGLSPVMPGTVGSVAALPFYFLLRDLPLWQYIGIVSLVFLLGWWASTKLCRELDLKDPGAVVIDEFVGVWIALAACPPVWWLVLLGWVVFRAFDIAKLPPPVGWLDRNLHGGLGIMADDVAAGVYALAVVQGVAAIWL